MAGRTSIGMASKIGGCRPEDFFNVLKPLGFEADTSPVEDELPGIQKAIPQFLKTAAAAQILTLDVRSMLAGGTDPLKLIQQQVKEMQTGQILKIVNTFEPTPLIKLLEKQGFLSYVDVVEPELVETYFYKPEGTESPELRNTTDEANDWDEL